MSVQTAQGVMVTGLSFALQRHMCPSVRKFLRCLHMCICGFREQEYTIIRSRPLPNLASLTFTVAEALAAGRASLQRTEDFSAMHGCSEASSRTNDGSSLFSDGRQR